jgi:hypothetical protein
MNTETLKIFLGFPDKTWDKYCKTRNLLRKMGINQNNFDSILPAIGKLSNTLKRNSKKIKYNAPMQLTNSIRNVFVSNGNTPLDARTVLIRMKKAGFKILRSYDHSLNCVRVTLCSSKRFKTIRRGLYQLKKG